MQNFPDLLTHISRVTVIRVWPDYELVLSFGSSLASDIEETEIEGNARNNANI